jgi:hypothetical protein
MSNSVLNEKLFLREYKKMGTFSLYIRKFRRDQMRYEEMRDYLLILYMRKPLVTYDFVSDPSQFSFFSVYVMGLIPRWSVLALR